MPARETYAAARERLLAEAGRLQIKDQTRTKNGGQPLKSPRIIFAGATVELGPQSAHLLPSGYSLWADYRGMSIGQLETSATDMAERLAK